MKRLMLFMIIVGLVLIPGVLACYPDCNSVSSINSESYNDPDSYSDSGFYQYSNPEEWNYEYVKDNAALVPESKMKEIPVKSLSKELMNEFSVDQKKAISPEQWGTSVNGKPFFDQGVDLDISNYGNAQEAIKNHYGMESFSVDSDVSGVSMKDGILESDLRQVVLSKDSNIAGVVVQADKIIITYKKGSADALDSGDLVGPPTPGDSGKMEVTGNGYIITDTEDGRITVLQKEMNEFNGDSFETSGSSDIGYIGYPNDLIDYNDYANDIADPDSLVIDNIDPNSIDWNSFRKRQDIIIETEYGVFAPKFEDSSSLNNIIIDENKFEIINSNGKTMYEIEIGDGSRLSNAEVTASYYKDGSVDYQKDGLAEVRITDNEEDYTVTLHNVGESRFATAQENGKETGFIIQNAKVEGYDIESIGTFNFDYEGSEEFPVFVVDDKDYRETIEDYTTKTTYDTEGWTIHTVKQHSEEEHKSFGVLSDKHFFLSETEGDTASMEVIYDNSETISADATYGMADLAREYEKRKDRLLTAFTVPTPEESSVEVTFSKTDEKGEDSITYNMNYNGKDGIQYLINEQEFNTIMLERRGDHFFNAPDAATSTSRSSITDLTMERQGGLYKQEITLTKTSIGWDGKESPAIEMTGDLEIENIDVLGGVTAQAKLKNGVLFVAGFSDAKITEVESDHIFVDFTGDGMSLRMDNIKGMVGGKEEADIRILRMTNDGQIRITDAEYSTETTINGKEVDIEASADIEYGDDFWRAMVFENAMREHIRENGEAFDQDYALFEQAPGSKITLNDMQFKRDGRTIATIEGEFYFNKESTATLLSDGSVVFKDEGFISELYPEYDAKTLSQFHEGEVLVDFKRESNPIPGFLEPGQIMLSWGDGFEVEAKNVQIYGSTPNVPDFLSAFVGDLMMVQCPDESTPTLKRAQVYTNVNDYVLEGALDMHMLSGSTGFAYDYEKREIVVDNLNLGWEMIGKEDNRQVYMEWDINGDYIDPDSGKQFFERMGELQQEYAEKGERVSNDDKLKAIFENLQGDNINVVSRSWILDEKSGEMEYQATLVLLGEQIDGIQRYESLGTLKELSDSDVEKLYGELGNRIQEKNPNEIGVGLGNLFYNMLFRKALRYQSRSDIESDE